MWAQIINIILGLSLMAAPAILSYSGTAADNSHIIGPVVATFAIISIWEATRAVRKYNIPLGAWLLLAPWVLSYDSTAAIIASMVIGALVICFALVKGKVKGRFGGGWKALWHDNSLHEQEAYKK